MKGKYRIGSRVRMSENALENYGEQYRGRVFVVTGRFDHECKPSQIKTDPTGHPGFDSGAGSPLYEFDGFNSALYEWEMEPA